jgi:hypothetical protein
MIDSAKQPHKPMAGERKSPREKAASNPGSAVLAIAAYCYHECQNEVAINSHKTKFAIKNCEVTGCPLWPFRGWKHVTGGSTTKKQNK